jgi:hypothetical protein
VDWVVVERFSVRGPAEMLAAMLRGTGIDAQVLGDDAGGVASFIGVGGGGVSVRVPDDQADEAREYLDALNSEDGRGPR